METETWNFLIYMLRYHTGLFLLAELLTLILLLMISDFIVDTWSWLRYD